MTLVVDGKEKGLRGGCGVTSHSLSYIIVFYRDICLLYLYYFNIHLASFIAYQPRSSSSMLRLRFTQLGRARGGFLVAREDAIIVTSF